jgi:hypothetical protein
MLTPLYDLLGPNGAIWALVIVSGIVFVVAGAFVPSIVSRCRGKKGPPLL